MVLPWMLHLALVSALLGVAGVAGEELARLYGKPRRWVWTAVLAGSPVLAFGPWLLARLGLSRPGAVSNAVVDAASTPLGMWRVEVPSWVFASAAESASGGIAGPVLAAIERAAAIVWPVASALAVVGVLWSLVRLQRRRRGWSERRIGGARVAVSVQSGPAVVGLLRPLLVVPGWVVREAELRRPVFRHESEHVRAGDAWLLAGAGVVLALAPWNPLAWWQARRLRAAVELDCDRRVLRRGERASGYGRMLLEMADRSGGPAGALATLAEPRTVLERRIRAMTEKQQEKRSVRAAVAAVIMGAVVAAACDANAPLMASAAAAATVQTAAVQSTAQAGAVHVRIRSDGTLEMNGRATTAETVMATLAGLGSEVPVTLTVDPRTDTRNPIEFLVSALAGPSDARGVVTAERPAEGAVAIEKQAVERAQTIQQQARELQRSRIEALGRVGAERPVQVEPLSVEARKLQEIQVKGLPAEPTFQVKRLSDEAVKLQEVRAAESMSVAIEPEKALIEQGVVKLRAVTEQLDAPQPLLIVDGVILGRSFDKTSLDALDIGSIEVIKGAEATQLYGSRAANGVISITTKRRGGG